MRKESATFSCEFLGISESAQVCLIKSSEFWVVYIISLRHILLAKTWNFNIFAEPMLPIADDNFYREKKIWNNQKQLFTLLAEKSKFRLIYFRNWLLSIHFIFLVLRDFLS